MKIALLGYGKMGKTIEKIALSRGHNIVLKVDQNTKYYDITKADVAIDFSIPEAAAANISLALNNNIPVISGTTGWLQDYDNISKLCRKQKGAFLYASNFSIGVNMFFELNSYLAKLISQVDKYNVHLCETHHVQKLDTPSGTAITLAEDIIMHSDYNNWSDDIGDTRTIPIKSERLNNVTGTHCVTYSSDEDSIKIKHTANNREGFGLGAIVAAEWIIGRCGIFTMKNVLKIN